MAFQTAGKRLQAAGWRMAPADSVRISRFLGGSFGNRRTLTITVGEQLLNSLDAHVGSRAKVEIDFENRAIRISRDDGNSMNPVYIRKRQSRRLCLLITLSETLLDQLFLTSRTLVDEDPEVDGNAVLSRFDGLTDY